MSEKTEKTETVIVPIGDIDPTKCHKKVIEFTKTKDPECLTLHWGLSPILVGIAQVKGGNQAQMQLVTTCLIFWKCSKPQAESFYNQQKLLIDRNGIPG